MSKLVKADELKNRFSFLFKWYGQLPCGEEDKLTQRIIKKCIAEIDKATFVDAVEVVRCADCAYYDSETGTCTIHFDERGEPFDVFSTGYCSDGEREPKHPIRKFK